MWSIKLQVNFSDFMAYHTGFSKRELLDLNSFQVTLGLESGPVLPWPLHPQKVLGYYDQLVQIFSSPKIHTINSVNLRHL